MATRNTTGAADNAATSDAETTIANLGLQQKLLTNWLLRKLLRLASIATAALVLLTLLALLSLLAVLVF